MADLVDPPLCSVLQTSAPASKRCEMHMVTMKHYWEVDIGLSESAKKFDLGWPWRGHFKVTKVKMARIISTVAPRPGVPIDKYVHHCPTNKSAPWPWLTFSGHFKVTNVKIVYIFLMVQDKHDCGYYETLLGSPYRPFRICKKFTLDNLEEVTSRSRNLKYKKLIWCHDSAIPARAGLLVR